MTALRKALMACWVGVVSAAGCSPTTVAERSAACRSIDWAEYGTEDGRRGVPEEEREPLFEECTNLGHPPDRTAYRAGYEAGLAEYCTAETGYNAGLAGERYHFVCPGESERAFLRGYTRGRDERGVDYYAYAPAYPPPYHYFRYRYRPYYRFPYWGHRYWRYPYWRHPHSRFGGHFGFHFHSW